AARVKQSVGENGHVTPPALVVNALGQSGDEAVLPSQNFSGDDHGSEEEGAEDVAEPFTMRAPFSGLCHRPRPSLENGLRKRLDGFPRCLARGICHRSGALDRRSAFLAAAFPFPCAYCGEEYSLHGFVDAPPPRRGEDLPD